jgi:hypothetical protein
VRRIAIILAVCTLMAAELGAEATNDRQSSAWPEEQESKSVPLAKWLPSVLKRGPTDDADSTSSPDPDPAAVEPAPPPPKQQRRKAASQPKPEPEPKRTPEEEAAEALWWKETGDPAVAAFRRCLAEHVADETGRGNQSSYPDFVTAAMNGRCSRDFSAMARLILDRHGEDNFAKIARKLIATEFVPAVKQAAEGGAPEAIQPADGRPSQAIGLEDGKSALEVEMRRSKEAMFGCFVGEANRLATSSVAAAERVADLVIASCQSSAEAYFGKLDQLYPRATGGEASQTATAILDASYRPAIVQRIDSVRADGGLADGGLADGGLAGSGRADSGRADRADADATGLKRPQAIRESFSPAGEPAPGFPAPASSRP